MFRLGLTATLLLSVIACACSSSLAGDVERFTQSFAAAQASFSAGDFRSAERDFEEAAQAAVRASRGQRPIQWVQCQEYRAQCLTQLLQLNDAIQLYQSCIEYSRANESNGDRVHRCRDGIATCYTWLSQYEDAERLYLQNAGDDPSAADRLNLGWLYVKWGRPEDAAQQLRKAVFLGDDERTQSARHALGFVALAQGNLDEAVVNFRESARLANSRTNQIHRRQADAMLGVCLSAKGQLAPAADKLLPARGELIRLWGRDHMEAAEIDHEAALLQNRLGQSQASLELLDEVRRRYHMFTTQMLPALGQQGQFNLLESDRRRLMDALAIASSNRSNERARRLALEWVINYKGLVDECTAARQRLFHELGSRHGRSRDLLRELASIRRRLSARVVGGQTRVQDTTVRDLYRRESEIARLLNLNLARPRWVSVEDIQNSLGEGETLIEFLRVDRKQPSTTAFLAGSPPDTDAHYMVWVVSRHRIHFETIPEATEIEKRVEAFLQHMEGVNTDLQSNPGLFRRHAADLEKVSRRLLDAIADVAYRPFENPLSASRQLVISPDGPLWFVPWAALPAGKHDSRYLIETKRVGEVVTSRSLAGSRPKLASSGAAVFADPDFNASSSKPSRYSETFAWGRLPGTRIEADRIEASLARFVGGDVDVFLGKDATVERFLALKRPRALVLATHGYCLTAPDSESPLLYTGLALAGANRAARVAPTGDDGLLTGMEVLNCDLRGTQVVVLSACETGLGKHAGGQGVRGLRQSFHLAGARNVVATLWKIPDATTADLMGEFWKELGQGAGPVSSLQASQIRVIQQLRRKTGAAHPYQWAAPTITKN